MVGASPGAILFSEQAVHRLNSDLGDTGLCPSDWADVRYFLAVARGGSFQAAARDEQVSVNTVRAHVEKLEAKLGCKLLRRTRTGCTISDAGAGLLEVARAMSKAGAKGCKGAGNVLVEPGEVRIACSEGLGLLWLTPRLGELIAGLDGLTANLIFDYRLDREKPAFCDVSLTFERPADPDMIVTRLATLHYIGFASKDYVRAHGLPRNLDEVGAHPIVEQVAPGVKSWLSDFFLGTDRRNGGVPVRTNSSLAQLWAVSNGAGIAAMPTFVHAITPDLVPIEPPLNLRFDLFCTYNADARGTPAIEATMAWLRACFDPQRYPWFRAEFVHPRDFSASGGKGTSSPFTGLGASIDLPRRTAARN